MKGSSGARWPKILLHYKICTAEFDLKMFQKGLTKKAEKEIFYFRDS
jgi:hypothetical protein